MLAPILFALLAAALVALLTAVLKRPREWAIRTARRIWLAISPRRREDTQRAIERIAEHLTTRLCMEEGNPDDEYRDDLYRWFIGDPDANIDYSRKQERDRERLKQGLYRPGS